MANCRFLSRFSLDATNNELRVTFTSDSVTYTYDLTFAVGDYYWSLDGSVSAGALDFGAELDSKLTTASSGESLSWTVDLLGVSDLATAGTTGALLIEADGGAGPTEEFTLVFSDTANTTIDPRIFGWSAAATDRTSDTTGTLLSDYAVRYSWCPGQPVWDSAPQSSTIIAAQSISTGGYTDSVYWATTTRARFEVQFVNSALVSLQCATESARATAAGITAGDINAPFEAWYSDAIAGGLWIREYNDITAHTTSDHMGPFVITLGGGVMHDSLGPAVRPMPGAADLYHVIFDATESL